MLAQQFMPGITITKKTHISKVSSSLLSGMSASDSMPVSVSTPEPAEPTVDSEPTGDPGIAVLVAETVTKSRPSAAVDAELYLDVILSCDRAAHADKSTEVFELDADA